MSLGYCNLRIVGLEGCGYVIHEGIQRDAVDKELELVSFTLNPVNCHMVAKGLVERREVRLVVPALGYDKCVK